MRAGSCGFLIGLLFVLFVNLGCDRKICDDELSRIGFWDTVFLSPCEDDFITISPRIAELHPEGATGDLVQNGISGEGSIGNGGVGSDDSFKDTSGSVLYVLKVRSESGQPRQYVHLDVELSGDVNLVSIAPEGGSCEVQGDSWLHCVLDADGNAYFRVFHQSRGAGSIRIMVHKNGAKEDALSGARSDISRRAHLKVQQSMPSGSFLHLSRSTEATGAMSNVLSCGAAELPCQDEREYALHGELVDSLGRSVFSTKSFSFELHLQTDSGSAVLGARGCSGMRAARLAVTTAAYMPMRTVASLCVGPFGFRGNILVSSGEGSVFTMPLNIPAVPYVLLDGAFASEGVAGAYNLEQRRARVLRCPDIPVFNAQIISPQQRLYSNEFGIVEGNFETSELMVILPRYDLDESEQILVCRGDL